MNLSPQILQYLFALPYINLTSTNNDGERDNCYRQFQQTDYKPHPEMYLTTPQVIERHGYPVETHTVMTEDGYMLTLFRIPPSSRHSRKRKHYHHHSHRRPKFYEPETGGDEEEQEGYRFPVFLNHGLFTNGHIWLMQPGERNLAIKLASEGFDVWLGNARGTKYSQVHSRYSVMDQRYWRFSFHEMGVHDIPAIIHYIRSVTRMPKVYYIGHSMGSTEYFIATSQIPELNNFIATAILYAPVAFLSNTIAFVKDIADFAEDLYLVTYDKFRGKLDGKSLFEEHLGQPVGEMCAYAEHACGICKDVNAGLFGRNPDQMNYTLQSLFFSHVPDFVSMRTLLHFSQLITSGQFRQFDYGTPEENEKRYGMPEPPPYQLDMVSAPTVFVWSDNDHLATPTDVNITASFLAPEALKESYRVPWELWTHGNYIKGIDADKLVYERTLEILKKKLYG